MSSPVITLSRRIRKTPFEERVFEQGAKAFSTYNHMPLASCFVSLEADYEHLCQYVQIWDVACERQVEVVGPDAEKLVELITPRDISKCKIGQCMYAPLVDEKGGVINDPIIIKLAEDRFWLSIADSGVLLWVKGLAFGRAYDVKVFEPDVSPLAIQGPKSDDLMADVFGNKVRDIKFFWFKTFSLLGMDLVIARSGWSGQGGFEIYLPDSAKGLALWDVMWKAGQIYNIKAGCPNIIDRIENGLLSFGNDITLKNNPFEVDLGRFFKLGKTAEYMSRAVLDDMQKNGSKKNIAYLAISGAPLTSLRHTWNVLDQNGETVGMITSVAYSKKYGVNLAFASVQAVVNQLGNCLKVKMSDGEVREAIVRDRNWNT